MSGTLAVWLGLDIGTSACKLAALDTEGTIVGSETVAYPTFSPHPGWAEQAPSDWLLAVQRVFALLLAARQGRRWSIQSITLTSAAHIGVLLDGRGQVIRNALLWSDQRSAAAAARLRSSYGDRVFELTHNQVSTSWTMAHIGWIQEHEYDLFAAVRRFCLSKDLLVHALTDCWVTDPATAVSAQLCDAGTLRWSEELLAMVGLQGVSLPEIQPAQTVVGTVTAAAAERFGIPQGIPVINGTLDSATETFGAGARGAGEIVMRIGTAGGIHLLKGDPQPHRRLLTYPYLIDRLWYSQAGTSSAGSAIGWAMSAAGLDRDPEGYARFDERAAAAPPGAAGLMFHPYLAGERTPYWNSALRATFSGASFQHSAPHFARAVLEGVACSLFDASQVLCAPENLPREIRVVGGGARDPVLMGIVSELFNRVVIPITIADSAYGAALIGLLASGAGTGLKMAADGGSLARIVPNGANVSLYRELFLRYRARAAVLEQMYGEAEA